MRGARQPGKQLGAGEAAASLLPLPGIGRELFCSLSSAWAASAIPATVWEGSGRRTVLPGAASSLISGQATRSLVPRKAPASPSVSRLLCLWPAVRLQGGSSSAARSLSSQLSGPRLPREK